MPSLIDCLTLFLPRRIPLSLHLPPWWKSTKGIIDNRARHHRTYEVYGTISNIEIILASHIYDTGDGHSIELPDMSYE